MPLRRRHICLPLFLCSAATVWAGSDGAASTGAATRPARPASAEAVAQFEKIVRPILDDYCFECHGDGEKEGSVAFDAFASTTELAGQADLWMAVLKNVRAGLMPPSKRDRLPGADGVAPVVSRCGA